MTLRNEQGYLALMKEIMADGNDRMDRTGTGSRALFGKQITYDLEGWQLPLLTTKKVRVASIIKELLWFLRGETNINTLGCGIWDQWADENGELGPIYGKQWRSWTTYDKYDGTPEGIDQIAQVMRSLKDDPYGRRHIVTAWNPADLEDAALPPCHCFFQFFVADGKLSCQLYQRSADLFIGVPFNIASYSILLMMMAKVLGYEPGKFIHTMGDVHIYHDHFDAVDTQLGREHLIKEFPKIHIASRDDIDSFELTDFIVIGYEPQPFISAPVAK